MPATNVGLGGATPHPPSPAVPPIFHVYFPATFPLVLRTVVQTGNECFVLGHTEICSGVPEKEDLEDDAVVGSSSAGWSKKKTVFSVVSNKPRPSSSRGSSKSGKGAGGGSKGRQKTSALADDGRHKARSHRVPVHVINVIGITSNCENIIPNSYGIQVVGKVGGGVYEGSGASNPMVHFKLEQTFDNEPEVSVEMVVWNRICFHPSPTQLIIFDYDPAEFQRWNWQLGYKIGLPKIFLDGISMIANGSIQETNMTPAFSQVNPDYQDLTACSRPPALVESNPVLNFICKRSSGVQQIIHKVSILGGALLGKYPVLPLLNFLLLIIVDSLIGYVISSFLVQVPDMLGLLHGTVDDMLVKLNHLLRWLRGAPAGLKLNPNLNSLFWRFFSYHIHLWANYIGIVEPVFILILNTIQYFGAIGATIQISLLKDLLSLATFHVYCLYIYATRLYSLQMTAIRALCRVFFGRKYNPLRKRLDHVQLATSELFLSSFGFVVLIFLFPTTLVYYAGFVCLRVPALLVERTMQFFVDTFNKLPFVSWALAHMNSPRVADETYLIIKSNAYSGTGSPMFRLCLSSTRINIQPPDIGKGIKALVNAISDGAVLKD